MKKINFLFIMGILFYSCSTDENKSVSSITDVDNKATETEQIPQTTYSQKVQSNSINSQCYFSRKEIPENNIGDQSKINEFYSTIKQKSQEFIINNNSDTIIKGLKGTEIFVPANSFSFIDNPFKNINGNICIELKECYNYSDMLIENLTTICNDNLLESAGMINIEASCDGEKLEIKKGSELAINFNSNNDNNVFDLYYGSFDESNNLNWEIDPLNCEPAPVVMLSLNGNKLNKREQKFINDMYLFTKEEKIALLNKNWQVSVSYDELGNVIGNDKGDSQNPIITKAINKFHEISKYYKNYVRNENFPNWEKKFSFACVSAEKANEIKIQNEKDEFKNISISNFIKPAKTFYSRKTGWINCDFAKFLRPIVNTPAAIISAYYLIKENMKKRSNVIINATGNTDNRDIKLIHKKSKTIVSGRFEAGKCVFYGVEANKDYYVVSTKCTNNEYYYCAQEFKTLYNNDIKINLAYNKYYSPQEIVEEYKKLDALLE